MMVPELPTDIWLQVVQFIPGDELDRLFCVNSLFFNIVLKKRYRHVRISNALKEKKKSTAYVRRITYVTSRPPGYDDNVPFQ